MRKELTTMTNPELLHSMIDRYESKAFTHKYIFGFTFRHNVYFVKAEASVLPYILCLDKASRGAGYSLRFCPTTAIKATLLKGAEVLCSETYFNEAVASCKYNRGEVFEKLVTEYYGQRWEKDNVPYWAGADLTVNGIGYQLKFEKATFTNEKTLGSC
jgi:hypothetical protein